jgi:hypothetical protein
MRLLLAAVCLAQGQTVATKGPSGPREGIPREQFAQLSSLIRPSPGGFEEIPWMTSLWEARKKAAAEGKPLLVWSGECHPLGAT